MFRKVVCPATGSSAACVNPTDRPNHDKIVHDKSAADVEDGGTLDGVTRALVGADGASILFVHLQPDLPQPSFGGERVDPVEQTLPEPVPLPLRQQVKFVELKAS